MNEPRVHGTAAHDHATAAHQHGTDGHDHGIAADANRRFLVAALALLACFMAGEVVVGLLTGSLALLSDAGHMLSDVGAIGIALWTMGLVRRPAEGVWTWGWQRAEVLSAAVNGITMLVVAGIVGVEAIQRLLEPPAVDGGPMLAVAVVGVVVNIAVAWLVARTTGQA